MKKIVAITMAMAIVQLTNCQDEGKIWFFGYGYGIDFSNDTPTPTYNSGMNTFEGSASYCDDDGNLLFYTNGGGRLPSSNPISQGGIWNRDNELMHNMQGLQGGGYSAAQSSIILPHPGHPNEYYLFTMEELEYAIDGTPSGQEQGRGFSYFKIDMNLNNGLGGVTIADQHIHVPAYESLEATIHANGMDYWIVIIDSNTGGFFVYKLDNSGIGSPSYAERVSTTPLSGPIKISPDGTMLVESSVLYDFNNSTGIISNPRTLDTNLEAAPSCFSPSSRYLYLSIEEEDSIKLKRYDTEAPNILTSEEPIFMSSAYISGHLQIGPDGNIYWNTIAKQNNKINYIHRISCTNTAIPYVEEAAFEFHTNNANYVGFIGLPNFSDHIFADDALGEVDLGEDQIIHCSSWPITLDTQIPNASYQWSTGDTTQQISIYDAGTYSVTTTNGCHQSIDEITISETITIPALQINGNPSICDGDVTTLTAISEQAIHYQWSTGITSPSITVNTVGTYLVTVVDECGYRNIDSIEVVLYPSPELEIHAVEHICVGDTIIIDAYAPGALQYAWSDGSTNEYIEVHKGGRYSLDVTFHCSSMDASFHLEEIAAPYVEILSDNTFCPGEEKRIELNAANVDIYQWSNGSKTKNISVDKEGKYVVAGMNECGTAIDSLILKPFGCDNCLYTPNAFSPNNDGRNDVFQPIAVCSLEDFEMKVFSRWGTLVYETQSLNNGWDGTFKGENLGSDVFVWMISFNQAGQQVWLEGDVSLVR